MPALPSTRPFTPPGPGTWKQDAAHSPRPITAWKFETFKDAFPRGFAEGTARYGLLFSHLEPAVVNGFLYYRDALVDGAEVGQRFAAAEHAFENKVWRDDLDRWDREYKPDSIRRNRALEATPMASLDTEAFLRHFDAVRDNASEMVYRHHIFSAGSVLPVGHYLANAAEWTGLDAGVLLAPLKGSSHVSLGSHDELREVGARLVEAGVEPASFEGMSAADTLAALRERRDPLGAAVRAYLDSIGMRLAHGYDMCDACVIELPEVLVGAIWASRSETPRGDGEAAAAKVRDAVPAARRDEFDELLADARLVNRLRDERGLLNDMWGNGIARQTLLEAGRRLVRDGVLDDAELAVDATHAELTSALRGNRSVTNEELRDRAEWRLHAPPAPLILGPPPSPPPPPDGLPPHARMAMRALGTALDELFSDGKGPEGAVLNGKPVSPGVHVGRARLIHSAADLNRVERGDVLVTISTSAAFNVVLPLLGAIVTDRGGQLSHAAIVAREYGIPAVVGTLTATTTVPDQARVEVDGTNGRVRLL